MVKTFFLFCFFFNLLLLFLLMHFSARKRGNIGVVPLPVTCKTAKVRRRLADRASSDDQTNKES
jgi:hypothetical protein